MKKGIILLITLFSFQYGIGQNTVVKKKNEKDLKHFSIADQVPFQNDCMNSSKNEKIRCLENELRNQILKIIGTETDYKGEMHLYFTVNKKGEPYDIIAKGFPSDQKLEKKIMNSVKELELKSGKYRGRKANIRCYTRVFPLEL